MINFDEEKLKEEYSSKKKTGLDEAKKLDFQCKLPCTIFTYIFGIVGSLILGVGMCLTMGVLGEATYLMPLGIVIGLIGIVMISTNYFIYKRWLEKRKEKYSGSILLALSKDSSNQ